MKTQKDRRTSKKGKTRRLNPKVTDSSRKITVEVNWNANDAGFSDLQNRRLFKFLMRNLGAGYNLIQTQPNTYFFAHGKTKLHLQAIKVTDWPIKLKWMKSDRSSLKPLLCSEYNDWVKRPPCGQGMNRAKIFAKLQSNEYVAGFSSYLWRIFSGEIDERKHKEFVRALKSTFKKKPLFIHNEDVSWFHAKEKI